MLYRPSAQYPELWMLINQSNIYIQTILAFIAVACIIGIALIAYKVPAVIASHLLKCDITEPAADYPKAYYVNNDPHIDIDRHSLAQYFYARPGRYIVVLEFTFEEMEEILKSMILNGELYYGLPKSFLMPDDITWFRPKITLRTAQRIVRALNDDRAVFLEYRRPHPPKKDRIIRTPAIVQIKANLHRPTYTSEGVLISPRN